MKLTYLTLLLIIISVKSFAFSPSWYKYYGCINNAEQLICKGDYSAAHEQYKMAYAINSKNISSVDLYNSFHTGMMVKDTTFAKQQLHKLLHRGLTEKIISNRLVKFYDDAEKKCIRQWIDLYINDTIVLSKKAIYILDLVEQDQDVRRNATGEYYGHEGVDSIDLVDNRVANELLHVLQGGIPDIDSIGTAKVPFNDSPYDIIIVHNALGAENSKTDFLFWDIITRALEQYCLTPGNLMEYARAYNTVGRKYMGASDRLMFDRVGYNDSSFVPKMNKSKIGPINTIRQRYGMCTIEEEVVKINYNNKVGSNGRFYISAAGVILDTEDRKELEDWQKKTIYPN